MAESDSGTLVPRPYLPRPYRGARRIVPWSPTGQVLLAAFVPLWMLCCLVEKAAGQTQVNRKYTEKLLAPFPAAVRDSAVISPDGRRIAYIEKVDNKQAAVFDGQREQPFDEVAELTFSPDSRHRAYAARDGKQWLIVVNGRPQPPQLRVGPPNFSPHSKRLAYTALLPDGEHVCVMELPGGPGKQYERIFEGRLVFSPDGNRLAYGARKGDKWLVVVDGRESELYDFLGSTTGIHFSPDGSRVAYAALVDKKWRLVLDGQMQQPHDNVGELAFSPDGKRVAYAAQDGGKWRVVVDGQPQADYDAIGEGTLMFSPKGERLVYAAQKDGKWMVVADGKPGRGFDSIGQIIFSPHGKRLAYVARDSGAEMVVLDGQPQRIFDRVGDGTLVFSPDSSRLGYVARVGRAAFVVVDGKRNPRYEMVGYLTFSPDNRNYVYAAIAEGRALTVVNQQQGMHRYDSIWTVPEARLLLDDRKTFRYLGVKEDKIYLVEEQID